MEPSLAGYSLVIVEDEEDIRTGLAELVDWASIGFRIGGVFAGAKAALRHLERADADVVLTDIVMPNVSGLDLARWLQENRPAVKVVILSGFDSFSYARQAIEYHVKHYLLKPTNIDELVELFRRIRGELDREGDERRRAQFVETRNRRLFLLYLQIMLSRFFGEGAADERLFAPFRELAELDAGAASGCCRLCALRRRSAATAGDAESGPEESELEALHRALNRDGGGLVFAPFFAGGDRVLVVVWQRPGAEHHDARSVERTVRSRLAAAGPRVAAELETGTVRSFRSFAELLAAERRRTETDGRRTPADGDDAAAGVEAFRALSPGSSGDPPSLFLLKNSVRALAAHMRAHALQADREPPPLLSDETALRRALSSDRAEAIYDYCAALVGAYLELHGTSDTLAVRGIKDFITEHVCEDLSLPRIAEAVSLNPVYASHLFKKKTGENITRFIMRAKVRRAKELLNDPRLKVYQVSEMVGYADTRHFYKVFKRICGITPQQYRNGVRA